MDSKLLLVLLPCFSFIFSMELNVKYASEDDNHCDFFIIAEANVPLKSLDASFTFYSQNMTLKIRSSNSTAGKYTYNISPLLNPRAEVTYKACYKDASPNNTCFTLKKIFLWEEVLGEVNDIVVSAIRMTTVEVHWTNVLWCNKNKAVYPAQYFLNFSKISDPSDSFQLQDNWRVEMKKNLSCLTEDKESCTLGDIDQPPKLDSSTNYSVRIRYKLNVMKNEFSSWSKPVYFQTDSAKPFNVIQVIQQCHLSKNTLKIQWLPKTTEAFHFRDISHFNLTLRYENKKDVLRIARQTDNTSTDTVKLSENDRPLAAGLQVCSTAGCSDYVESCTFPAPQTKEKNPGQVSDGHIVAAVVGTILAVSLIALAAFKLLKSRKEGNGEDYDGVSPREIEMQGNDGHQYTNAYDPVPGKGTSQVDLLDSTTT